MLEEKLYSLLSGSTIITVNVSDRIYPNIAPQNIASPYIVYTRISGGQVNDLNGYSTLESPRIQIDIFSTSYLQQKNIGADVHTVMQTSTSQNFRSTLQSNSDIYENDAELFRGSMDFVCWNRE